MLGPVRNQGMRPTCVAFAASDAHAVLRGKYEALSVEHIYYHAVNRTPGGDPAVGVSLEAVLRALQVDGQCIEQGWPYLHLLPRDLSAWVPPWTATPRYRCTAVLPAKSIDEIVGMLDADCPVVVTILLGQRFYIPIAGVIELGAGDVDTVYHAILAIGHGYKRQKRYILIRNSWGDGWGLSGNAWVAAEYLQRRLHKLARMEDVI